MNVLGISCFYHDAAASLVQNGRVVAAAMEERFTRKKHDVGFPINAILYCLRRGGVDADALDAIAFYENPKLKFERVLYRHLDAWPDSRDVFVRSVGSWLTSKLPIRRTIRRSLRGFPIKCPIYTVQHHLSHAASAYYCSPFQDAAILTIDGVGEWATTAWGVAEGPLISLRDEIRFPHSLGLMYSALTAYLGFKVNNSEYKVMGLAGFGQPKYQKELERLVTVYEDGSFALSLEYFDFWSQEGAYSQKLVDLLGPARKKQDPVTQRHMDIAASAQRVLEEAIYRIATAVHSKTRLNRICMAGGVLLNSLANGRFLERTPFTDMYIPPAPGDDGGAVGAALYTCCRLETASWLGTREYYHDGMEVQLGPAYTQEEVDFFCRARGIDAQRLPSDDELAEHVSELIAAGNVVGWFQGGMEWGPRALGHRSILADPRDPRMQDILNEKVKHRERFRPFAPSVCAEDAWRYFDVERMQPIPAQYMLTVRPVREEFKSALPAITHVDGTARLHAVDETRNPLFHRLLCAFKRRTGYPVIVNTSFNVRGEPVVCTPSDAFNCFLRTDIDYLVMGRSVVSKTANAHLADTLPPSPNYEESDE